MLGSEAALPAEAGEGAGGGVRGREVARCVAVLDGLLLGGSRARRNCPPPHLHTICSAAACAAVDAAIVL